MANKAYYHPDCQILNRQAKLYPTSNEKSLVEVLLERIFTQDKSEPPAQYDPYLLQKLFDTITNIKASINWEQELVGASFVVFDTETTGVDPLKGDEIISVGAVVVENGCITEESEFYTMVNPGRPISPKSQKITGISDEMLVGQPAIGEVLLDFLEFAGPRILVAHRAPFDIAFMNVKLCEVIGRRVVNPVIDTAILASSVYPFYDDYSLENLAPRCKVDLAGRHHALADARIAASIFIHLLAQLEEKGVTNLPQLAQLFKEANKRSSYPIGY